MWINHEDHHAPKDRPFLAREEGSIAILRWTQRRVSDMEVHEFYGLFNQHCCCCTGYCSAEFTEWMEFPA